MFREFVEKIGDLTAKGVNFAVATVVDTEGSTSSKAGAKSIIGEGGEVYYTNIFGGCVESAVIQAAQSVLGTGIPRLVKIKMTDELAAEDEGDDVIGVGMPCGGTMDVYVEPYVPKPQLLIVGDGPLPRALSMLGKILGFHVVVGGVSVDEELFPDADVIARDLTDRSWADPRRKTYAVVATQLQTDDRIMKDVLDGGVEYVALVASKNRAKIVLGYLMDKGVTERELRKIHSPAGLDIGAKAAEEIALSIMAEILKVRYGRTGTSLSDLKGLDLAEISKERAGRDSP